MVRLIGLIKSSPVARFLICGGTAAAINWFARIGLSFVMPFEAAIVVAYVIGMTAGFLLYRTLVWPGQSGGWQREVPAFILVNVAGAVVVLAVAVALDAAGSSIFGPSSIIEALAHGTAIAVGAVANYLGHSRITFAGRQPAE